MDEAKRQHMGEEFSLFSVCYSHFVLEKKVDTLEVQDFVTELYNRNYYMKIVSDELERGRRLRQPLSVVKIAMDDFYEIESSLGEAVRDELLKSLASVVAKTSRTNDVTCRTGMNEMAMILPHCSRKGAALRAERLRRIVEGTSFLNNGMKVSVSLGISEFPTLCDSVSGLDETASKALLHILDKGGNKICLFKAPENHRPEFEVVE
ncbi:Diguanylate cyclase DosC [compost metagenome]